MGDERGSARDELGRVADLAAGREEEATRPLGAKIFLMLISASIFLLGPMIGIAVGFVWCDPQGSILKRRDGRELLIFSSVLFVFELVILACFFANLAEFVQSGVFEAPRGLGPLP